MKIRKANAMDADGIMELLGQVLLVHHKIRPDLFLETGAKYTKQELEDLMLDEKRPIFVAEESGKIVAHCFTIWERMEGPNLVTQDALYIDDLCVDQSMRGRGVGKQMYEYACSYGKAHGASRITLHVWTGNAAAQKFYEDLGFQEFYKAMEMKL